jgi:hypothetical protein
MVAGVFASVGAATAQGAPLTLFWSEFVAALVGRATASGGRADTGLSATPSFFDSVATDERGVTYSLLEQRLRGIIVEMRGGETTSAEKETTTWREDYSGL